jgi:hypothetical protein
LVEPLLFPVRVRIAEVGPGTIVVVFFPPPQAEIPATRLNAKTIRNTLRLLLLRATNDKAAIAPVTTKGIVLKGER